MSLSAIVTMKFVYKRRLANQDRLIKFLMTKGYEYIDSLPPRAWGAETSIWDVRAMKTCSCVSAALLVGQTALGGHGLVDMG